jgi:putative ABC transport system permease protein
VRALPGVAAAGLARTVVLSGSGSRISVSQVEGYQAGPDESLAFDYNGFGVLALLLTAVGIYGVMTYAVTRRTREIGIRMALGAQVADVLRLVLGEGLLLTLLGLGVGLAGAFATTHVLRSFLFGVSPLDPVTFGSLGLLLAAIALLACWWPAARAAKVDPMTALRSE